MWLAELHNFTGDILRSALWERLLIDNAFADGFCWGIFLALAVGTVSRFLLYFWSRFTGPIRNFFKATKQPASVPGPSPASRLSSCIGGIFGLIIFTLVVVWLVVVISDLP